MVELRIKDILKEKGMTAKSLADNMKKSPQYINDIINGGKGASLNTLKEIAKALGVPISSLFADYEQQATIICPKCGNKMIIEVKSK